MANKKELIEDINEATNLLEKVKENETLRAKLVEYITTMIAELITKLP